MKSIYSPKMLELSDSPCESFNDIESEKSVYVRISKRKEAISAEDSNSYLDIRLF